MCIALISTLHPDYPFILLNNRDEYLTRPTARASFWDAPHTHVLAGRDLLREVRGTWLGITKQGRIAVLTNFREDGPLPVSGVKSRGAMVNSFLTTAPDSDETTARFARRLVEEVGVEDVGGFSLVVGKLMPFGGASAKADASADADADAEAHARPGLAIISNRSARASDVTWIASAPGEIHGLSNSFFGDLSWPKVVDGQRFVREAIEANVETSAGKEDLVARLFAVLSLDTLPRRKEGEEWEVFLRQLRHSIYIPRLGGEGIEKNAAEDIAAAKHVDQPVVTSGDGCYATQKQTVILVDKQGKVTFIEKTLFDENCRPLEDSKEEITFDIEGWGA